jgi:hypothetical protein
VVVGVLGKFVDYRRGASRARLRALTTSMSLIASLRISSEPFEHVGNVLHVGHVSNVPVFGSSTSNSRQFFQTRQACLLISPDAGHGMTLARNPISSGGL